MAYAKNTKVSEFKSQMDIKKLLIGFGATNIATAEPADKAMVQFDLKGKRIRFLMPLPQYKKERDKKGWLMNDKQVDQLTRSKWRILLLTLKAKLESVESKITTLEEEFLAHIVVPSSNTTVGQHMIGELEKSYKEGGQLPLLLGGPSA